jgi:hypothetical protein
VKRLALILVVPVLAFGVAGCSGTSSSATEKKCDRVGLNPSEVNIHGGATGIEECEEHEKTFAKEAQEEASKHYHCQENSAQPVVKDCEADERK